jgi:hypothetical protein
MPRRFHHFILFAAFGFFAGCSTPALVLDSSHPASADAPEANVEPPRSSLRADEATRRTRELLQQRERQAAAAESESAATPGQQDHEHQ